MAIDEEVLKAIDTVFEENKLNKSATKTLQDWLNAMSDGDLPQDKHKVYLIKLISQLQLEV